jgi:hypothetical protein
MFGALRFVWNATRGNRLTPWRSAYLKWRIETYSGRPAHSIGFFAFCTFVLNQKRALLHFLGWTSQMAALERTKPDTH